MWSLACLLQLGKPFVQGYLHHSGQAPECHQQTAPGLRVLPDVELRQVSCTPAHNSIEHIIAGTVISESKIARDPLKPWVTSKAATLIMREVLKVGSSLHWMLTRRMDICLSRWKEEWEGRHKKVHPLVMLVDWSCSKHRCCQNQWLGVVLSNCQTLQPIPNELILCLSNTCVWHNCTINQRESQVLLTNWRANIG